MVQSASLSVSDYSERRRKDKMFANMIELYLPALSVCTWFASHPSRGTPSICKSRRSAWNVFERRSSSHSAGLSLDSRRGVMGCRPL